MKTPADDLANEANILHLALFSIPASIEIQQAYIEAHNYYLLNPDTSDQKTFNQIVQIGIDLEAIELILRRKNSTNVLTKKFHILSYITEARSSYFNYYVNTKDQFLYGLFITAKLGLRTVYKLSKGIYLNWRYRVS